MLRKIGLSWIALCLLLNSAVFAQTFPKGQRLKIGDQTEQCYTFDEYKDILKFQIDCQACQETNGILTQKVDTQQTIIDKQDQMLKLKDNDIGILQGEKDRLFKMWSEENLQRHKLENRPILGSWVGWTVAGVFAVTSVFLAGWVIAK